MRSSTIQKPFQENGAHALATISPYFSSVIFSVCRKPSASIVTK